ncbi:MAG: DUF4268 domain-containing protein [Chloroflexota bacterium]|nr:DUF4268 domain-containing protein [Chloroflexota bacterium]
MTVPEDEIEQVEVRKMWEHEALDFTPWLAKNLDLLGGALGMKLEDAQVEVPVGPYFLDILAREADDGVLVAIENQLEETDLHHLGQLLTYATGCDAQVAIWVAPEFGYEHAQALHRLNEWTQESIRFFGVKVEVFKKARGGDLEARFRKVVYPGGWDKEATLKSGEMPATKRQYYDFFQPLITEMLGDGFADKAVQYYDYTGRFFPSRFDEETGYAVSFWKNGVWVSLHVRTWDSIERNNLIFDELQKAKPEIEESLDAEWVWHRFGPNSFFTINIRRDGSIEDRPEKLEEIRAWVLDQLPKLKDVLDPHLERVLKEPQSEG